MVRPSYLEVPMILPFHLDNASFAALRCDYGDITVVTLGLAAPSYRLSYNNAYLYLASYLYYSFFL